MKNSNNPIAIWIPDSLMEELVTKLIVVFQCLILNLTPLVLCSHLKCQCTKFIYHLKNFYFRQRSIRTYIFTHQNKNLNSYPSKGIVLTQKSGKQLGFQAVLLLLEFKAVKVLPWNRITFRGDRI